MRWSIFAAQTSEAGPSRSTISSATGNAIDTEVSPTSPQAPTLSRWEAVLQDEEKYQAAQYPTYDEVPRCLTLMDEFFMCYALFPQLRSFYRSGEPRDCMYKWADFKYCLSLKSEDDGVRRELWVKRKAEWWAKRRIGRSSEDVWDVRREPLENFPPLHPEEIPAEETAK